MNENVTNICRYQNKMNVKFRGSKDASEENQAKGKWKIYIFKVDLSPLKGITQHTQIVQTIECSEKKGEKKVISSHLTFDGYIYY